MADDTDTATDPYRLDDQVGYLLRLATQRHTAIFQTMAPGDLTPTQFATMMRLSEQGSCSQNQLGRLAAMDISTIKGVVDRLRQKGLVQTEPSSEDRRRSLVSLTADGAAMIDMLVRAGRRITAATLDPLTPSEQRSLLRLLGKMG